MTSRELRQSFLDFFARQDHRIIPSAPLKPTDATTLFTSAGMQPFVPWFRGLVPPEAPRAATCQKCFRADDIEQVGLTPWHNTFFEMLGNFSFGDYFKRETIAFAWEYVTKVLKLPQARIWITVHPEDEEAPKIWRQIADVPESRIVHDPDNFWALGPTGPCGPCTEMHLDGGEDTGCGRPDCSPLCACSRFTELWNLVFQMYNRQDSGELEPLPQPGIDTGMGMERMAALIQDVPSIFDTDLFAPIVSAVIARARKSNPKLPEELDGRQTQAARVVADHTRALAFLLADGFTPSNEGAGYVLRRVLRRAYRFGRRFGVEGPFLNELVPAIVDTMGPVYPELVGAQSRIGTWIEQEERQFEETLERSLGPLVSTIEKAKSQGLGVLPGEDAFRLHDTYGLPMELAAEIAGEYGLTLDAEGFEHAMAQQRERARARSEDDFAFAVRSGYQSFSGKTTFLGYQSCGAQGTVIGIVRDGQLTESLGQGEEGEVFLDQTPFYAEAGGQVGDHGTLSGDDFASEVLDTYYPVENAHAHKVRVTSGTLKTAQHVNAQVDEARRQAIARAHTATHLLHHMLRDVLGDHAVQSGSLVDADRLRFDFAHFSPLTEEEKRRIEEGVLELALADSDLDTQEMSREDAQRSGAVALFGEKYGAQVRVVQIGSFSRELCGGTHLAHAGAIGGFSIVSEGSIGAGLRRIEAVTGREAQKLALSHRERLGRLAVTLDTPSERLDERVDTLKEELRAARRELEEKKKREFEAYVRGSLDTEIREQSETVEGINFLAMRVADMPSDDLRDLADRAVSTIEPGVVVVGCEHDGRAQFAARVSKDLVKEGLHAGNLIREVAKIAGGGGGGRPDFAQAGGKNPERLDEALAKAKELVAAQKG